MKAAVLLENNTPLVVEDLDLAEPKRGEVLVRYVASGVCHTDLSMMQALRPIPLPMILGHEGAGIVERGRARRDAHQAGRPLHRQSRSRSAADVSSAPRGGRTSA